jgi:cytochrome c-type biogenesis protein
MMIVIGLVLYVLQQSFGALLALALPLVYGVVIVLGVLMLTGRSPFARLATAQAPVIRNPYAMAYVYGLLLAPMTLPCTGPVILGAFLTAAGDAGALLDGIAFFLFFGLGFGWPLLVLPLLAVPFQRRFVGFLTRHHLLMTRLSGALLVAVGVFGIITELLPQWTGGAVEFVGAPALVYWALAALVTAGVGYFTYRAEQRTPAPLAVSRQAE